MIAVWILLSTVETQNLREVIGTTRIMIMSLLLQREHIFFRLMIVDGNRMPLVSLPVCRLVGQGHEGAYPPHNIFPTPTKAPEGATINNLEKQNSILLPYGGMVLMANYEELQ
jgi:hypothetical protein